MGHYSDSWKELGKDDITTETRKMPILSHQLQTNITPGSTRQSFPKNHQLETRLIQNDRQYGFRPRRACKQN